MKTSYNEVYRVIRDSVVFGHSIPHKFRCSLTVTKPTNPYCRYTQTIYWDLFPTVDHLIPIARGGQDNESNSMTTSMVRNAAKSNWTIEELGLKLFNKGQLGNWNGLINYFIELTTKNQDYKTDSYVNTWRLALIKAMNDL